MKAPTESPIALQACAGYRIIIASAPQIEGGLSLLERPRDNQVMAPTPAFTIATLVTDPSLYEQMKASFREKGFADDCEFLTVDNTGSRQTDAYAGLNRLLNQASAPLVILCHQDVVLFGDGRTELEARLRELSELDPCWALAGNGGGSGFDRLHIRITDKFGDNQRRNGPFPVRVHSLDENFIVVRAEARIGLSRNLTGFHMYGTDICLVADILGWNAYVIDYHLQHLGEARMGPAFAASLDQFRRKWNHALRERYLQSTCTRVLVTGAGQPDLVKKLRLRTRSAFFGLRRRIGTLIAK